VPAAASSAQPLVELYAPASDCMKTSDGWSAGCPAERHQVGVENKGGMNVRLCLKSTSTLRDGASGGDQRDCVHLQTSETGKLSVPYRDSDKILMDVEIFMPWSENHNDYDMTGRTNCVMYGVTAGWEFDCGKSSAADVTVAKPSIAAYQPAMGSNEDPLKYLLNILAWAVTAASVAGLIITGINMALQLRRGEPGEFSEHWRGLVYVGSACMLGLTAGPIVQFLQILEFLGK
jgi:hypothetical protein